MYDYRQMIAVIPSEDRSVRLKVAASLYVEYGDEAYDSYIEWATQSAERKSAVSMWKWGRRVRKITVASLVMLAKQHGWTPERNTPWNPTPRAPLDLSAEIAAKQKHDSNAAYILRTMVPIGVGQSHPYLERKKIPLAHRLNLSIYKGLLVIPMYPFSGSGNNAEDVQLIDDQGNKKFLSGGTGATNKFAFCGFDAKSTPISAWDYISVCEGWGTGMGYHLLTGAPVLAGFNDSNSVKLVEYIHKTYPHKRIMYIADNDESQAGQRAARQVSAIADIWMSSTKGADASDVAAELL